MPIILPDSTKFDADSDRISTSRPELKKIADAVNTLATEWNNQGDSFGSGGITDIVAGTNVTVSSPDSAGAVTIDVSTTTGFDQGEFLEGTNRVRTILTGSPTANDNFPYSQDAGELRIIDTDKTSGNIYISISNQPADNGYLDKIHFYEVYNTESSPTGKIYLTAETDDSGGNVTTEIAEIAYSTFGIINNGSTIASPSSSSYGSRVSFAHMTTTTTIGGTVYRVLYLWNFTNNTIQSFYFNGPQI